MPELPPLRPRTQLRRMVVTMMCALPLCYLPGGVLAQSVFAGLRACTRQADPGRRLACYDMEMERLSQPAASTPPVTSTPAVTPAPAAKPIGRGSGPTPANPDLPASHAAAAVPPAAAPTSVSPKRAGRDSPTPRRPPVWKILAGGDASSRLTAHVAHLDRSPDAMVLQLDNGQVWRQIGRASGDLSLHEGDNVTIEKHLGSYWLSSRYISNMQVRQETQQSH